MTGRLAALAAQYVGRRVRLKPAEHVGTIARVTATGLVIKVEGVTADDVAEWLD